ncbi:MAG: Na+/H+ antiporter subunit E [Methanomicrobiaceae archaeon]|uniref:Cation antiporter n=1 Tax=hydrocarbon metagenome TaxID=938273 RepID=A0A0W8FE52_9ZZZZ|nr:Na+/H+ antiporter subunit E [Methanomicrobiaceae archaeon]MDD5419170.1 Na+/H+ antiporter subunit E [Methanomicrobiaceae archaeon]
MKGGGTRIAVVFAILFTFWVLLSGYFDAFHLTAGIICAGIVTILSHDLLMPDAGDRILRKTARFIGYIPWLLLAILRGGLDVAYRVLHPAMPINPCIVTFETPLHGDLARTTLANSITLTPGTVTVDVEGGRFVVHVLAPEFAYGLTKEETMQKRVSAIFEEDR